MKTIFQKSKKGRNNFRIEEAGVEEKKMSDLIPPELIRKNYIGLPRLSENEVLRHFTDLSLKNYGVDNGIYPLGSCTMKYNPKINEEISNLGCFTDIHPYQDEEDIQGCLQIFFELGELLKKIIGLEAVTFQPAAGAHGELCGLLMAKKYFDMGGAEASTLQKSKIKENIIRRNRVIIPDSAHGTNFSSASMAGFEVIEIKSDKKTGTIDVGLLKDIICREQDNIAVIMITNPNTLGIFEKDILQISEIARKNKSLLYYDGANLNAIIGKVKPGDMGFDIVHLNLHKTFSAPHGGGGPGSGPILVGGKLKEFLPAPTVVKKDDRYFLDYSLKNSIGRMKSFYGNFSVILKAYCYLLSIGDGIKTIAEDSVLNACYLKHRLEDHFDITYSKNTMHEFVISARNQKGTGVSALNIAKRLIDYGIHPPTVYFPSIVEEAIMIEPSETENIDRLDYLVEALKKILDEAKSNPGILQNAPFKGDIRRIDELRALKEPVLKEPELGK
jgi:glycine dehydrogenase subunit 2